MRLTCKKPNVSYFRVFGCDAFMHLPKDLRGKLDAKSNKHVFVGYNLVSTWYHLFDVDIESLVVSRDVIFHETLVSEGGFNKRP